MVKKKDSIALFEVISKSRANQEQLDMNVPAWMGGQAGEPATEQSVKAKATKGKAKPPPSEWSDAIVSTDGGKLRLSLDYTSCSVLAGVLLLLLAIAFVLGRATAGGETGPETAGPAAGGETPAAMGGEIATMQPRVTGKYYLVIQGMQGETQAIRTEADKIVTYLGENNIAAEVRLWPGNPRQFIVWSLDPYDIHDSPEARQYVENIEALGQRYLAGGGNYGFKQAKGSAWWIPYRGE